MKFNLERFIEPQQKFFETALLEIKGGKKQTHWMWYVFPQMKGLGESFTSEYYGIESIEEAKAYMENNYLANNLITITEVLLELKSNNALELMGYPDNLKLKSSMTLFYQSTKNDLFLKVLQKYFDGALDEATISLLN